MLHLNKTTDEPVVIDSFEGISRKYEEKWLEEKYEFQSKLKENFESLVSNFRSGQQSVFELSDGPYHDAYIGAFRELFIDSGYAANVGDWAHPQNGSKKTRSLLITLPSCFSSCGGRL